MTADAFAAARGINSNTLRGWKLRIEHKGRQEGSMTNEENLVDRIRRIKAHATDLERQQFEALQKAQEAAQALIARANEQAQELIKQAKHNHAESIQAMREFGLTAPDRTQQLPLLPAAGAVAVAVAATAAAAAPIRQFKGANRNATVRATQLLIARGTVPECPLSAHVYGRTDNRALSNLRRLMQHLIDRGEAGSSACSVPGPSRHVYWLEKRGVDRWSKAQEDAA